jgi:chemotaxis protein methyltransferase CheR
VRQVNTTLSSPPQSVSYLNGGIDSELTPRQFAAICHLLYSTCGIKLTAGKEGLVKARLMKRLRQLSLPDFEAYLDYVRKDTSTRELTTMVDALTTNKTSFFRENEHFRFVQERLIPDFRRTQRSVRIWSAGCSTGEEPYSMAMLLRQEWPEVLRCDVRILATDISNRVLAKAQEGVYSDEGVAGLDRALLSRYFDPVKEASGTQYKIHNELKSMIRFARLNLMEPWPMRGPFDFIFCRNVMIYFDKETQKKLVRRYWEYLVPNGFLFVGHSESLTTCSTGYKYVQPALYQKFTP